MFVARVLFVAIGVFAPAAAWAQDSCKLAMTVQLQSCEVANYERCGDGWRITFSDGAGPFFISEIDNETRWIRSVSLEWGEVDSLSPDAVDEASFSELLATGRDTYDFKTRSSVSGQETRFVGYDSLANETVMVDGVSLQKSEFAMTAYGADGAVMWKRAGSQFVSREMRVFFGGTEVFENAAGGREQTTSAPVSFAFEGDEGFGAQEPELSCDMVLSQAGTVSTLEGRS
ncbi:hypothetical protein [Albirhodobacter sp. R86504]|jgi:hypothetical protein|uniref:hypothetical protein n=1 Tax=Albirhodobacter sp. R86504 TaxID=3093848 RepID=UPI0036713251